MAAEAQRRISYSRGIGSLDHNNRVYLTPNVEKDRVADNITLVTQPIDEAYEEIFGEAQAAYNQKQKRADRKINDYYKHVFGGEPSNDIVKDNGKNPRQSFYEYCIGIGTMHDTGYAANPEAAKKAEQCLREFIEGIPELDGNGNPILKLDKNGNPIPKLDKKGKPMFDENKNPLYEYEMKIKSFQERNPNFYLFNAVIHCDEATPHLHYDFIPFADGYKQGMTRQQGIAKALEQMGYGKGKDAIKKFTEDERKIFRTICESHGFDVAPEKKGRGYTFTCEEMRDEELQRFIREVEGYEGKLEDYQKQVADLETQISDTERQLATLSEKVEDAQSDYNEIVGKIQREQAKLDALHTAVDEAQARLDAINKQADEAALQIVMAVDVPPRPTEPIAPQPLPEKADWKTRNAHKAAVKSYEKALAAYPAELAEWEKNNLTIDNIQKAQRQLTQDLQNAQPMLDKAEQLRQIQEALINGQKQLAAAKKKHAEDAEALEQAKVAFAKGKAAVIAIEARKVAEQILEANGYKLGGYGIDEQMQQAQLQQQQNQKGGIVR